jgi:AcrR family transcriptional regulator
MTTPMKPPTQPKRGRPKVLGLAERRRDEILDAATGVFARDGYACADLQEVADSLEVGKGTLYRYFPTKDAMFQAAVDRVMSSMQAHIDAQLTDALDPLDRIATAVRAYLEFFDAHPEYVELLIQERAHFKDRKKPTYFEHREKNVGRWQELYRQLIASGRVRQMSIDRITDVMSNQMYGRVFTNYFAGRTKPLREQADDLLDVIWNGILTKDERARRNGHEENR